MARGLVAIRALSPEPVEGDQLVTATKFHQDTGHCLWRVTKGQQVLIVTEHGRPVAAVIPLPELERLRQCERALYALEAQWRKEVIDGLRNLDV